MWKVELKVVRQSKHKLDDQNPIEIRSIEPEIRMHPMHWKIELKIARKSQTKLNESILIEIWSIDSEKRICH